MKMGLSFLLALLGGVLSLVILGRSEATFTSAVLLTIGFMCVYFGRILWNGRITRSYDRYADSFYYLGFMLTLVTLLMALFQSQSHDLDVGTLIGKFSLGLITTLVGLGGRVFLSEFGGGTEEIEEDIVFRIRERTEALATHLELSVSTLLESHRSIISSTIAQNETTSRSVADMVSRITEHLNSLGTQIAAAAENLRASSTDSNRALVDSTQAAVKEIKQIGLTASTDICKIVSDLIGDVTRTTEEFKHRVMTFEVPADLVREALAKSLLAVQKELTEFEASVNAVRQRTVSIASELADVVAKFGRTNSQLDDLGGDSGSLSKTIQSMQQFESSLVKAKTSISEVDNVFTQQLATSLASVLEVKDQMEATLRAVGNLRTQLDAEVQSSVEATRKVHQSLVESVRFVSDKLR